MTLDRKFFGPVLCRRRFAGLAAATGLVLVLPAGLKAASCSDADVVKSAAEALMAAASAGSAEQFAEAFRTYADVDAFTMFALGKYRKALPEERRQELFDLTTNFVSRTFNDFRLKFKAQSIVVGDCRNSVVESVLKFRGQQGKQPVFWRMKGGRIIDVNVQNLWLGQLLRDDFYSVMAAKNGDIDALFAHLKS